MVFGTRVLKYWLLGEGVRSFEGFRHMEEMYQQLLVRRCFRVQSLGHGIFLEINIPSTAGFSSWSQEDVEGATK